jgi:prepilin-type N-terminal cleavage/methylation domain-containing protein
MRSTTNPPPTNAGFTLVELLVVITIIVVLLALLTPALDKAIYEAEMAADLANMRGIATAATIYAMDHKRNYPYREDARGRDTSQGTATESMVGVSPHGFSSPNNVRDVRSGIGYDMRAKMKDYTGLKQFVGCPFSQEVDLSDDGSTGSTMITADYALFFGWQYKNKAGMFKVGDKFGYSDRRFSVLVADVDVYDPNNILSWASHPDDFQLGEMVWQNFGDAGRGDPQASAVAYGALVSDPGFSWTWSRWDCRAVGATGMEEWYRAPLDDNFAFADGSAKRFDDVTLDVGLREPDERMSRAAIYRDGGPRLILPRP